MEATVHMEKPWAEHACSEVLAELVAQADAYWHLELVSIEACFGSASIGGRGG